MFICNSCCIWQDFLKDKLLVISPKCSHLSTGSFYPPSKQKEKKWERYSRPLEKTYLEAFLLSLLVIKNIEINSLD